MKFSKTSVIHCTILCFAIKCITPLDAIHYSHTQKDPKRYTEAKIEAIVEKASCQPFGQYQHN